MQKFINNIGPKTATALNIINEQDYFMGDYVLEFPNPDHEAKMEEFAD